MISANNTSTNLIDLLNLYGLFTKTKDNKYFFSLLNLDKTSVDEIYQIIDPSDEQVFKILFKGDYIINNINGFQRAISLIQSLLYEFKGNKIISKLDYLPNEIPEISNIKRNQLRILDYNFLCFFTDNTKYVIDLTIQNYYYDGLDLNALLYGEDLKKAFNLPVIIIVLLLKKSDEKETDFKLIDDDVYVFCLDLFYVLDCIESNTEPELNGLKLAKEGKEWIKLLTIKHWMRKCKSGDFCRYPVPKNLNNSKEIISAINLLDVFDESKLVKNIPNEDDYICEYYNINVEDVRKKFLIKIWINAFLKGKLPSLSIIPFPEVANEFLIRSSKSILKNKNDCISFLKWLIENKIVERKDIQQKLINEIYR